MVDLEDYLHKYIFLKYLTIYFYFYGRWLLRLPEPIPEEKKLPVTSLWNELWQFGGLAEIPCMAMPFVRT